MIIYITGPRLRVSKHHQLQEALYRALCKRDMLTRGFGRKDVRIFFLQLAYPPETVEVAVFAGSAVATTYREVTVWKEIIEPAIATTYPKYVINGFVVRLDATAQFTSGTPLFVPKYKAKQKKAPQR